MLKTIEPPLHESHKTPINSLLALLTREHGFSLPPKVQARSTFLIASEDKNGVYGGVVLYPQKIAATLDLEPNDTVEENAIKLTSAFQPKGDEYWVARIVLYLERGSSASAMQDAQDICHRFYHNLYRAFASFGERMGLEYLGYTLRIAETYHLKAPTSWPYQLGIVPVDAKDGFIHGILSLKGKSFRPRRRPTKWGRTP